MQSNVKTISNIWSLKSGKNIAVSRYNDTKLHPMCGYSPRKNVCLWLLCIHILILYWYYIDFKKLLECPPGFASDNAKMQSNVKTISNIRSSKFGKNNAVSGYNGQKLNPMWR